MPKPAGMDSPALPKRDLCLRLGDDSDNGAFRERAGATSSFRSFGPSIVPPLDQYDASLAVAEPRQVDLCLVALVRDPEAELVGEADRDAHLKPPFGSAGPA
jgi:hypothetical protein